MAKTRRSPSQRALDALTPEFREKHKVDVVREGDPDGQPVTHCVVRDQTPLDRYLARGQIGETQHRGGDRFRTAYWTAGLDPLRAIDPARILVDGGGADGLTEGRMKARAEYHSALRALGQLAPVAVEVCCVGNDARAWAQGQGYSGNQASSAGMVALKLALDALAEHFGV